MSLYPGDFASPHELIGRRFTFTSGLVWLQCAGLGTVAEVHDAPNASGRPGYALILRFQGELQRVAWSYFRDHAVLQDEEDVPS